MEAERKRLQAEQNRSERLLLNILPPSIAERLKQDRGIIADSFVEVTALFADLVDFTQLTEQLPADRLVELLNQTFSCFDRLAEHHGLEKIKTIGDAYMAVAGLPDPQPHHAQMAAEMALDMQAALANLSQETDHSLEIRIGIHTGPAIAGVIGLKKFAYDLWGDTVNTASRMESQGVDGCIQVTESTYRSLKEDYCLEPRGQVAIKGKGEMTTYLLQGRKKRIN